MPKIRPLPPRFQFMHMKTLKIVLFLLVVSLLYAIFNSTISIRFKYNEIIAIGSKSKKLTNGGGDYPPAYSRPRPNSLYYSFETTENKDPAIASNQDSQEVKGQAIENLVTLPQRLAAPTKPVFVVPETKVVVAEPNENLLERHIKHTEDAKTILEGRNLTEKSADPFGQTVDPEYENEAPDISRWWLTDNNTEPNCDSKKPWEFKKWKKPVVNDSQLWPGSCDEFKAFWSYPEKPMSHEESEYPLAYIFMSHRNLHQTLRLFRAIYHPQNVYCVNWDQKSATVYKSTMEKMTGCFDNVMKPKEHRNIYWCHNSILKATMDCMNLLHLSKRPWKYVQIVSWNDFPLKTNFELVQIYKRLNGSVDSDLEHPRLTRIILDPSNKINPVPPGGLVLYKGTYAATMPREFISFVFEHPIAQRFFNWLDSTRCGEEYFWATLVHNRFLKAPGHFPGSCIDTYDHLKSPKPFISRYQLWEPIPEDYRMCKGKMVLYSCVFGIENVAGLKTQPHLMGHKFYEEIEPAALYCTEKWHYEKTFNRTPLSNSRLAYYSNFQAVKFHNMDEEQKENYRCAERLDKNFKNFGKL